MEPKMSSYDEVMTRARGMNGAVSSPSLQGVLSLKTAMSQIVDFLRNELPKMKLDVNSSDATNVSRDILELNRNLQSLQTYLSEADNALGTALPQFGEVVKSLREVVDDFEESASCVSDCISELQSPVVNVENVKVQNLNEAVSVLNDILKAVKDKEITESVKVTNLKDLQFPKEIKLSAKAMGYLAKLELLSTGPDSPISVRLSDGEKFTKAIADGVKDGVKVISAGTSGNVFINSSGSPVKPQLDSSGNIQVASTVSAVTTGTCSSVNDSASSVTLLSANTSRRGFVIFNDSTAILYVKLGATASTSSFSYRLTPYGTLSETNFRYTGVIDGIWASDASGAARITELT